MVRTTETVMGADDQSLPSTPTEMTGEPVLDTIQPLTGWWMYETEPPEASEAREAERKGLKTELEVIYQRMTELEWKNCDSDWNQIIAIENKLEELGTY